MAQDKDQFLEKKVSLSKSSIFPIRRYYDIIMTLSFSFVKREREREREGKLTLPLSRVIYGNYLTKTFIFKLICVDV